MNEWFTITQTILVPADWADADAIQMMFKHGLDTNRELHVQSIKAYIITLNNQN